MDVLRITVFDCMSISLDITRGDLKSQTPVILGTFARKDIVDLFHSMHNETPASNLLLLHHHIHLTAFVPGPLCLCRLADL